MTGVQTCALPISRIVADRVLLVGLGREREYGESKFRSAIASAVKALKSTGATDATICFTEATPGKRDIAWKVAQSVLGALDGTYRFDRLKSKKVGAKASLRKFTFLVPDAAAIAACKAAAARAKAVADGVAFAKDLGNLPANICTPTYLASEARELAKRYRMKATVLGQIGRAHV